jgi:CheY-like chemotaxis protein
MTLWGRFGGRLAARRTPPHAAFRSMKAVKAVTLREPLASQVARGETATVNKGFRTPYRGEILIVSGEEPGYGLALAELHDVRSAAKTPGAPGRRGYAWSFRNVVPITRFMVPPRAGLFTVHIPEGALPPELRTPVFGSEARTLATTAEIDAVKGSLARDLRLARSGFRRVRGALRELQQSAPIDDMEKQTLDGFEGTASAILRQTEDLVSDMIRMDAVLRRELEPSWSERPVATVDREGVEPPRQRAGDRLNILIVEDEPRMARGVQRSLSTAHEVRVAASKQQALEEIRRRVPDILLCDHRLEWQKTDDLFEHVRDHYPTVRRILYSFSHVEVWTDLVQRKLVDAVVPKSAPRNVLISALR